MADRNFIINLIYLLKRWPRIYRLLRGGVIHAKMFLIESVRLFSIRLRLGIRLGGPRGFFSAQELLKRGEGKGGELFPGQELPPLRAGTSLIRAMGCNQNGRQPWPVFWLRMKDARLVGTSLAPVDEHKRLLIESVYGEEFCRTDPSYNYLLLPSPVKLKGSWTSIISYWYDGYYHWFNDALPRLAPLEEFPVGTKILIRGPLRPYQRESLEILGLLDRVRETAERHLLIEDFYFSSPLGISGCTNPFVAKWLREKFLPNIKVGTTPKKFFIIRSGKTRGIRNQEEVAEFFRSAGWTVVDLEKLSLVEQISWFANAEAVVGEHGGGFTNLVWCRPGTKVLELCAKNFLNGCYEGISLCNGLQHRFEVFSSDHKHRITIPPQSIIQLIEAC
jgi:hypothetical protein